MDNIINPHSLLSLSLIYVCILFAIAYYCEKRGKKGRSITNNPYIYSLALGVYCTAWAFYGSVGQASKTGVGFMPIYIGPTLMMVTGWVIVKKLIRISKVHHITSLADLIASRYGKSSVLGGFVSIVAVFGIIPYISLQLKAIPVSYLVITGKGDLSALKDFSSIPIYSDTSFYITLVLSLFAILFGTRQLTSAERHEGMVASVAFGSIVKLAAFLTAGMFITYGVFNSFPDILTQADLTGKFKHLFTMGTASITHADWVMYIIISMLAFLLLPRQFQMTVIENMDEKHLNKAIWIFPLYLLIINFFVLPIAIGGLLKFNDAGLGADTFVLSLSMLENNSWLTLFIFIGGLSAAVDMVIVETVALSTMISNNLIMPFLIWMPGLNFSKRSNLNRFILYIRRVSIITILLMGYFYFRYIGEFFALISSGLISFVAIAQFAPLVFGGIFWRGATKKGAITALSTGVCIWVYTLILPSLAKTGTLPETFITAGPFGIEILKPYNLFGLTGLNPVAHSAFWSLFVNIATYVTVSLFSRPTTLEQTQAELFVNVFKYGTDSKESVFWKGTANVPDLKSLLIRFLGKGRTEKALQTYAVQHDTDFSSNPNADPELVSYAEKLLSSAIGSASARVMVASVVKEEPLDIEDIMGVLDETSQVMEYSRRLEKANAANVRLKELDNLKDEFLATVTHELRTPLTSVRSLSEILHETPDIDSETKKTFLATIMSESDRLQRLIGQTLDFQKIESGTVEWVVQEVDIIKVINNSILSLKPLIDEKKIDFEVILPETSPVIEGDQDMLMQVVINIISNGIKFCDKESPKISVRLSKQGNDIKVNIKNNGPPVDEHDRKKIFERFIQLKSSDNTKPEGTGLGLTISKRIIDFHHGEIGVEESDDGADFYFTLPFASGTIS
ncbi:MAG: histidine kinase [Deltaproteobacteria bacterium]|nr:histidine kinase [Deltaproteobacteria bacterium]